MSPIIYIIGAVVVAIALIIALITTSYIKAPPDTAFIISGLKAKPRTVIGKATLKLPFLERKDTLSLKLIPVDIKTSNAVPTADYINIKVDAAVNIKISSDTDKLILASENFLNQKTDYICAVAKEVLEGNTREIVGKMNLQEMVNDRQKFAELVKENAEPDLAAMGLDIVSFNVQNFFDENGIIENLGIENISQIKKNAAIAKAKAEKEVAVEQAKAKKEANDAQVASELEIAKKNNEFALEQAKLQIIEQTEKAKADAAYNIQQETQRKQIEIEKANAEIAKQEKEAEVKKQEVFVTEQALEAQVKKQAEAERYEREQKAQAELFERQKDAEAKKFEKEQEAEAMKAVAEAEFIKKKKEAEAVKEAGRAESEAIKAKGLAEAEAIKAKGQAEAEALEKKAEAYQKYNNAAMVESIVKVLPDMAEKFANTLAGIDNVSIIGGDGNGMNAYMENLPIGMAKVFQTVKATTGVDLTEIVKAETYDAKVNRNVNVTGITEITDVENTAT